MYETQHHIAATNRNHARDNDPAGAFTRLPQTSDQAAQQRTYGYKSDYQSEAQWPNSKMPLRKRHKQHGHGAHEKIQSDVQEAERAYRLPEDQTQAMKDPSRHGRGGDRNRRR